MNYLDSKFVVINYRTILQSFITVFNQNFEKRVTLDIL